MTLQKLSSVRLTIFLCILLAMVSLVGTLVPQNLTEEQYQANYGRFMGKTIVVTGLADVYHSGGFAALLCLLALNLVACTSSRFPAVWRSIRKGRDAGKAAAPDIKAWKNQASIFLALDVKKDGKEADRLEQDIRKALGRGTKRLQGDSTTAPVFFAEKNRLARLGPYASHAGILIILAGALVGAWLGVSGSVALTEGEETDVFNLKDERQTKPLGFKIRLDRFRIEYYPSFQTGIGALASTMGETVKEYRSEVSLLDDGGTVTKEAAIRVNHPLTHKGITFYQSTFGKMPLLSLRVVDSESGEESNLETELNVPFPLPGKHGDRGLVMDFHEELRIPDAMLKMTRFPSSVLGPAARVGVLVQEQGFAQPVWVLQNYPNVDEGANSRYRFILKGHRMIPYTGLQVARDPGVPLVWFGCLLLVLGFSVSFLWDHEFVYVTVEPGPKNQTIIRVAGRTVRHPTVYAGRFERQKRKLVKALSAWAPLS